MIGLGVNERCENRLDELEATGSEIITPGDQFIRFLDDFLVTSNPEVLFGHR